MTVCATQGIGNLLVETKFGGWYLETAALRRYGIANEVCALTAYCAVYVILLLIYNNDNLVVGSIRTAQLCDVPQYERCEEQP